MADPAPLLTRWGRALDPDRPLPEHPRPQLVRATDWRNLNGRWEHAFRPAATGRRAPSSWDGPIVVPFSPEAPLSGVGRQLQPDEELWYRRTFRPPARASADDRVLLHFGAVDQLCTVWVNGVEVGAHVGGYLPFTLDVTDALVDGGGADELLVRVRDLSETGWHARGKQRLDRGTIWYTAQSGIWQTVWLEVAPRSYVASLRTVPLLADGAVEVTAVLDEHSATRKPAPTLRVVVRAEGDVVGEAAGPADRPLRVPVSMVRPWSPEDPFLYDLDVTLETTDGVVDRVTSYAALRSVEVTPGRGIALNGEEVLQVGVLDQGYWPDGLMTPPADAAMVHDITTMKDLGCTMLRKHAKIEPLRWYHHCDRLGMLVWQDVVNGGGRYRDLTTQRPARHPVWLPDRLHRVYDRRERAGREEFLAEVERTVELLGGTACVVVWTPFNEGWGQFDANAVARLVKRLDPTRLVNHVSGWVDQGGGDIRSHHSYLKPFVLKRRRRDRRPVALTEYGGYSLALQGHDWRDREYGYRHLTSVEELAEAFAALHRDEIEPAVAAGLVATVYTQLSDVEDELNGLLTWDREVLKVPADVVRDAFDRLRELFATAR